jgi:hypothetical protein
MVAARAAAAAEHGEEFIDDDEGLAEASSEADSAAAEA